MFNPKCSIRHTQPTANSHFGTNQFYIMTRFAVIMSTIPKKLMRVWADSRLTSSRVICSTARSIECSHRQNALLHNYLELTPYLSKQTPVLLNPLYLNRSPCVHLSIHRGFLFAIAQWATEQKSVTRVTNFPSEWQTIICFSTQNKRTNRTAFLWPYLQNWVISMHLTISSSQTIETNTELSCLEQTFEMRVFARDFC